MSNAVFIAAMQHVLVLDNDNRSLGLIVTM
jgi:hypothetical protein